MEKIKLITTSTCPNCAEAKQWLKDNYEEQEYEILIADQNEQAMVLAGEYRITQVPRFIYKNEVKTLQEMKTIIS